MTQKAGLSCLNFVAETMFQYALGFTAAFNTL